MRIKSLQSRHRETALFRAMLAVSGLLFVPGILPGQASSGQKLMFTDKVRMVNCEPASSIPCFRLKFNIVDAQGGASSAALPSAEHLAQSLTINVEDQTLSPFFAVASTQSQGQVSGRLALILVDISGSMEKHVSTGESRFEAAKAAISYFLEGFENGVDRVAIVPFESHRVAAMIQSARFAASRAEAQRQVDALPAPGPRNNTALYSAVDRGLDLLEEEVKSAGGSPEALLFVLTDGENDVQVQRGDDAGLLTGSQGLEKVASKVRAYSAIRVIAVGFGDSREVDQDALRQLSNKFRMVTDTEGLKKVFKHPDAAPLSSGIVATFSSPWQDRASLAAKTLHVRVALQLPTGEKLESNETTWSTPEMGLPLFESRCEPGEGDALLSSTKLAGTSGWMSMLRPMLVFAGLGAALFILWFWVPRIVWADQYVGSFQPQAQGRWAPGASAPRPGGPPLGRPAPPGFQEGKAGASVPQRAPGDATTVLPVNLMGTRTRLELRRPPEKEREK